MERVDSGFLNYVFILYTPFKNKPNDATSLRQVTVSVLSIIQLGFRARIVDVIQ
jgi:hypothetical protein